MATSAVKGRRARILLRNPQQTVPTTEAGKNLLSFHEVRNWTLTPTQEMIDASSADSSGWNEFIPGQRGWVFTAESAFAPTTSFASTAIPGGVSNSIRNIMRLMFHPTSNRRFQFFQLQLNVEPRGAFLTGSTLATSTDPLSQGPYWRAGTTTSTGGNDVRAFVENFRVGGRYNDVQLFDLTIRGVGALTYYST